jgi:ATP-binding cassette subfamily B multidrug efflux pump
LKSLLAKYLRPYRRQIALVVVLTLIQTMANLYLPSLMADIINRGIAKGDTGYIFRTGGLMLGITFVQAICAIIGVYWGSKTAMAFGRDVRSVIFRTVESFSQREVNHFGTPSLITRNTNDVQQVQMLVVLALNMMLAAPIMLFGGVIMALREDVVLSGLIVVIVPLMAAVIGITVWRVMPRFRAQQVKLDRVNQVMRENLSGMRVIRAFVRTRFERRRFDEANSDLTATALSINRTFALMIPLLMLIFNLSTVAIMWFGGHRIASGAMPIGNITAFLTYMMIILMSVMMAVFMLVMVPRAAASAERIQQVLQTEPSVIDPAIIDGVGEGRGFLEFDDVEFGYPGAEDPVLRHITFSAAPGEITAIVGSTGSGKSTLINLIPRLFDATGGHIRVDGVDIRNMPRQRLWAKIGFVPQKAFLFSGTVASNLRYGKDDANTDELWHALAVAQARDFVSEMPEQLEAPVTQGGASVSGGQRQRLAIARALVKRPEIYVFDDSFSALDFRTDAQLRAALKHETADATVLIVAQRVSTILNADRIIVLEDGTIAGMGTHDELMAACETYREIVYSQLSAEEIA